MRVTNRADLERSTVATVAETDEKDEVEVAERDEAQVVGNLVGTGKEEVEAKLGPIEEARKVSASP